MSATPSPLAAALSERAYLAIDGGKSALRCLEGLARDVQKGRRAIDPYQPTSDWPLQLHRFLTRCTGDDRVAGDTASPASTIGILAFEILSSPCLLWPEEFPLRTNWEEPDGPDTSPDARRYLEAIPIVEALRTRTGAIEGPTTERGIPSPSHPRDASLGEALLDAFGGRFLHQAVEKMPNGGVALRPPGHTLMERRVRSWFCSYFEGVLLAALATRALGPSSLPLDVMADLLRDAFTKGLFATRVDDRRLYFGIMASRALFASP